MEKKEYRTPETKVFALWQETILLSASSQLIGDWDDEELADEDIDLY